MSRQTSIARLFPALLVLVIVLSLVAGLALFTRQLATAPEAEANPQENEPGRSISVDVVIEEVDLAARTLTARSTLCVIPPHDEVGGAVQATGTTGPHSGQVTRFVRLPVMPAAKLADRPPKAGQRAILRLELLQQESDPTLVVVGIEEFVGLERIGVGWLDAPGANDGT